MKNIIILIASLLLLALFSNSVYAQMLNNKQKKMIDIQIVGMDAKMIHEKFSITCLNHSKQPEVCWPSNTSVIFRYALPTYKKGPYPVAESVSYIKVCSHLHQDGEITHCKIFPITEGTNIIKVSFSGGETDNRAISYSVTNAAKDR